VAFAVGFISDTVIEKIMGRARTFLGGDGEDSASRTSGAPRGSRDARVGQANAAGNGHGALAPREAAAQDAGREISEGGAPAPGEPLTRVIAAAMVEGSPNLGGIRPPEISASDDRIVDAGGPEGGLAATAGATASAGTDTVTEGDERGGRG
jgi:hypothetical protein